MLQIKFKIIALLLLAALFFSGCEEEIYTQFCTKEKVPPVGIDCLNIESIDPEVDNFLKEQNIHVNITKECPFTLVGMHYHVKACKNPVANSRGADFDGYVKLQVFQNGVCYYRVQQDFKSSPWQKQMPHIVKRLKKDLNLH